MNLDYLVIYCSDPEASAEWYASALALRFTKEQHGSRGPLHFSSEIGGTILELYPAADGLPRSRVRLGVTCPTSSASTPRRASSQTRTATASRFAPRRPDPPPRCYTHRMETTRVSTDARRLIAQDQAGREPESDRVRLRDHGVGGRADRSQLLRRIETAPAVWSGQFRTHVRRRGSGRSPATRAVRRPSRAAKR